MYPPFWLPRKEGTYHFCHLVQPDYVEQWTIFASCFNLEYLEVASNLGLFRVRYKGKRISPKDMLDFYNKAYFRFMDKCKVNKIVIDRYYYSFHSPSSVFSIYSWNFLSSNSSIFASIFLPKTSSILSRCSWYHMAYSIAEFWRSTLSISLMFNDCKVRYEMCLYAYHFVK